MSLSSRRTFGTPVWLNAFLPILALIGAAAPAMAQTATFISSPNNPDTTTQGNWKGVYGQDGYIIPLDSNVMPTYDSTVSTTGTSTFQWVTSTTDSRALLEGASLTTRIASTYYNPNPLIPTFSIDVNITDGKTHQVTLYLLDWERSSRTQTINVVNASNPSSVLSTVNASNFGNGVYYAWNISGHVTIQVTQTGSQSAVVSGIFFGTSTPASISITNPAPGNVSGVLALSATASDPVGVSSVQFQLDGKNIATAVTGTGPTYTTTWDSSTAPSNGSHTLTAVLTDTLGRQTTSAGVQLNISGAGPPPPQAIYLKTVTTPPASGNMGDWKTLYGQDGYLIPNEPTNPTAVPSYASIALLGSSGLAPIAYAYLDTLPQDVNDGRAMQWAGSAPANLSNGSYSTTNPPRNPSVYFDGTSMTADINLSDGQSHQIAVYALDFDSSARAETISILDGNTLAVLSSQSISSFHAGEFLLWTIKGHVKVQIVNNNAGDNVVFSGIYFGGGVPAPAVSVTQPASGPVAGIVTVAATATSNGSQIASVQFQLDGVNLGAALTASPYQVMWDTTTAISGSHALSAIATDVLGQSTTSGGVTVTVNNPAPAVTITAPAGPSVLGTVTVSATASSTNNQIASVQFKLDGTLLGTATAQPYSVQWNTNTVQNGSHTLIAIATDTLGQTTTSAPDTLTVSNGGPNVSVTAPAGGAQTGTITVTATTSQTNAPVASVQFTLDGANFGQLQLGTGPTFSVQLDTTTIASGSHALRAIATDNLGQSTTSAAVTITITNPPPTISITAPSGGATVVGSTTLTANAASPTAKVASVQFKLDNVNLNSAVAGSGSTFSASTIWASTTATNGSHTLTAVVTDTLGQTTTSAGVTVTVSNPPPVISITNPAALATVSGSLTVQANATSTIGMASVQFKLDGANLGTAVNGPGPNYSTQWFTGTASNGSHTLTAIATDTQSQTTTSSTVTVTVTNTPPSISITNPSPSATLLGTVSLTATATSSTSTIASVQFQADGVNIGAAVTGTGPTFNGSWNTGNVTNGPHTLTAIATDAIGITKTSASVSVTVNNPAPTISITSPTGTFALVGTVNVTASAASAIGLASVQFQLDGSNLGAKVNGGGPNFTTQWITTSVANGSHVLTAIATDTQNQSTTSSPVTVNVSNGPPPPPSAVFLKTDAITKGNWKGAYGADGYIIANDSNVTPGYVTLTPPGAPAGGTAYTWLPSDPADVRVLLKGASTTDRIASTFATSTSFNYDINFNDGQVHQFAVYALDFDTTTRTETVSILNANTNAVLNSQTLQSFNGGLYALWSLQGHVIVKVTFTGGLNAVMSGFFFDTPVPPPPPPTISLISPAAGPVSGTVTVSANATSSAAIASVQFQVDGQNLGAPVTGAGPIYSFTWDTTTIANGSHLLAAIATDTLKQTTTSAAVSVTSSNMVTSPVISMTAPAAGTATGTVTVSANATAVAGVTGVQFLLDGVNLGALQTGAGPVYSIQWNSINASNAPHTLSAIATDALNQTTTSAGVVVTVANVTPSATFIKLDTTTQGNWKGVYGKDGSIIPNDATSLPAYATVTVPNPAVAPPYTWVASSSDVRALLKTASTTDRIASVWYNTSSFTFNVNTSDGLTHQLALYCLDLDNSGRAETITILNANTNAVLATEAMSAFGNGVYSVFNITGNVLVTVTYKGGSNAVLSGFFLSTIIPPPPPPTVSVTTPTAPATVVGTITLTANATAGAGMSSVQFQVDNKNAGAAITGAGPTFTGQWNTTAGTNGSHVITAIATDILGQTTTSAGVTVTVNNPLAPPVISITAPNAGPVSGTVTVTANATAIAGMSQVQFLLDGSSLGTAVTGAGPTYTFQWNTVPVTSGAHVLSAVATDAASQKTTSATVNVTVSNTGPSATFVKTDAVTQGNWVGVYGGDGYIIPNDANSPPSYAVISGPGQNGIAYTWVASTTDSRALLTAPSGSNRIASTWYTPNDSNPYMFDVNVTDGQTHQLALYLWDLDNAGRAETITILNANTTAVLLNQPMSAFQNGVYAVFNITGHVQVKFTWTGGANAVLSGLFLSTVVPPPPPPGVSINTPAPTTSITGTTALSATASSTVGLASVQFKVDGNNIGAPVTGSGPTFIAQWNSVTVANGSHNLTAVATDTMGQAGTSSAVPVTTLNTVTLPAISITAPATGTVSGVVTVTANATATAGMASVQFQVDGTNLGSAITGAGPTFTAQWNSVSVTNGSHTLTAIATDAINQTTTSSVVSVTVANVFPSATFITLDKTTQGNWKGVYGVDGYIIANDSNNPPSYATVTPPSASVGPAYTWIGSTTDVRALVKGASQTDRIASTWYTASNGTPFVFDVNLTDGLTHQLALYVLDYENGGRAENISILNGSTKAVLVTQPMTSFGGGVYAIFNVTGHVQVQVSFTGSALNAVLSGLFLSTPPPPPSISITAPTGTGTQSGAISLIANATANTPATMASVQFQVDGNNVGAPVTGPGPSFTTPWNTTTATNGSHALTAIATDSLGQTTTSSAISVTTSNVVAPPVISITAPAPGVIMGTVNVTANATSVAGISSVQFLLDGNSLGAAVTGAGPTYSYQWNTLSSNGPHTLTAVATDAAHVTTTSLPVTVTVTNVAPSATFVKTDAVTQGNWVGVYGGDGYIIPNDANSPPSYAAITGPGAAGIPYTWLASSTNPSALLNGPSTSSRTATTFYTTTNFSINVNLTDGQTHQLALYLWDLENFGRTETLSILNANTNAVLATKAMSSFGGGVYAVFTITGNVTLQVTDTSTGSSAVLSGLFFSTPVPPTVSLTAPLTTNPQSGTISVTASATAHSPAGMASVQFQVDDANIGAPVTGSGPTFTTQWNTATTTNGSHSLTAVATDTLGQTATSTAVSVTTSNAPALPVINITAPVPGGVSATITVTANATAVAGMKSVQFLLDGSNLGSLQNGSGPNFSVQWNTTGLSGGHALTAVATDNLGNTATSATVAVNVSNVVSSASFVKLDAVTQGNWPGVYGSDGYIIPNDANSPPSYVTVTGPGAAGPAYTWLASTTSPSALFTGPSTSARIASTFYTSTSFNINLDVTDGQTHQVALYVWDLENAGRTETLSILNPSTNAVLATKAMTSFGGGVYAVFNISGNVTLQVSFTGNVLNAVLSGLFFSTPTPPTVSLTTLTSPQSGVISVAANATAHSPAGMASVQFQVDGNNLGAPVTGSGPVFTTQWNTAASTNGSHSLTAIATDTLGQTATSSAVSVTTSNAPASPVINITTPVPGIVSGNVTVSASATAVAGMKSVQFLLDGSNLGSLQTGSGPNFSVQWNTTGATGGHTLTAVATDNIGNTTTAATVSVTVSNAGPSATFIKLDAVTKGNWPGVYGADGYIIPNDTSSPPSYVTVTGPGAAGPAYTWFLPTTSVGGLFTGPSATTRIASTYYTSTSFSINLNVTDGQTHQVALYLWDLENAGRTETLSILNTSTSAVLATQTMSSFGGGVYAVFNITGNVTLQVTFTGNVLNAVLSGLFFSTPVPPPPAPTISLTAPLTSPQSGTINVTASAVANSPATMASVQFQIDGANLGAAVTGPGPTFTTQWSTGNFSNGSHTVTAIATDSFSQTTTSSPVSITLNNPITAPVISITAPTSGTVSGTVSVTATATASAGMKSVQFLLDGSNLGAAVTGAGPTYTVQWITSTTGPHVLTAVATDTTNIATTSAPVNVTVSTTGSSASLLRLDTTTKGNWPGVYGADGYVIPNNTSITPSYATVTVAGASPYTWLFPTTDVRGLLTSPSSTSRIASTWYSYNSSFNINVNLTDGQLHQVALYALDYDTTTRSETISILDATSNTVLVTQPMPTFNGGIYAVFNIRGNVIVQVTNNNGTPNIVLSGLFFRSFNGVQPPTVSVTAPGGGATVSGAVTLTANAASTQGITSVQFQIDGVNQGPVQTGSGPNYSIQWASPEVSSGVHAVTAVATDTLGLSTTSPAVSIVVANGAPPANSAVFLGSDTTTSGNWVGVYGSDGYMMADGGPDPVPGPPGLPTVINNAPFYAVVNLDGALQWTWHDGFPATGSFALPISPTSSILIGAAYYQHFTLGGSNNLPLNVDVTFADNQTHQLSLYLVDWHHNVRHQQINIVDPNTHAVLSTQSIINFDEGIYLKYNVQGHVQVQVTLIPDNSDQSSIADSVVMAAMFFDPAH